MAYEKVTEVVTDGQHTVSLFQNKSGKFRVNYGLHSESNLSYGTAAKEFGECVFHALACAGLIEDKE